MKKIPIIIAAYNRDLSLKRLLNSISKGNFIGYENIPLIISIDYSKNKKVLKIADEFNWKFGNKLIIQHKYNLGLKKHIILCGDLVKDYDAVIMLEDDLIVSTEFYDYSQKATAFYQDDNRISGIALFSPIYNEASHHIFNSIIDGYDNYFMQVPASCGQVWTKNHWNEFKTFISNNEIDYSCLHPVYQNWPTKSSWKKDYFAFMVNKGLYFVYPFFSLTSNFGDIGVHYVLNFKKHQVRLLTNKRNYMFSRFDESNIFYNQYYEATSKLIKALNYDLQELDFECDFYGNIDISKIKNKYLLSIKECKKPIYSFGSDLIPPEMNIALSNPGDFYHIGLKKDFDNNSKLNDKILKLKSNNSKVDLQMFKQEIINSMKRTKEYRYGSLILKPLRMLKKKFFKIC